MSSYVKMKFGTLSGKDLNITVNDVPDDLDDATLQEAMDMIVEGNAISGDHMGLSSVKDGKLYKVTTQVFNFNE